jgi:hypothetical protein
MTFFLNFFSLMSPTWVIEDILVYLLAAGVLFFWMKTSKEKAPYLFLELVAFVFVYASVYENVAVTLAHVYTYGPSLIMIGNVPLSLPLIEGLLVLGGLAIVNSMQVPTWSKPFLVGLFAMLQDLSLDPLGACQVAHIGGGVSARLQWLIVKPGMASLFNEPAYNWSGWFYFAFFATICLSLGRWWFNKSNGHPLVGVVYPFVSLLVALAIILSPPVGPMMLWLGPFFAQGSVSEWIMFGFYLLFPVILLLVFWRGRMQRSLVLRETWPVFGIFVFPHASDLVFTLIGGYWNVLWIVVLSSVVHTLILLTIYLSGRRVAATKHRKEANSSMTPETDWSLLIPRS